MKVKAAVARSHGDRLRLESLELAEPATDEILVRLVASGVAQTDIDAIDGRLAMPLPFVPGCEGAGIVERVGSGVTAIEPGESVVVTFDYCGHCESCAAGHPLACRDRAALNLAGRRIEGSFPFVAADGPVNGWFFGQSSFATHLLCRAARAIKVDRNAPLETLACLGGDLLLGAGALLSGFGIGAGDMLVVTGANSIGLMAILVAKAVGANVLVVADTDDARLGRAGALGARLTSHRFEGLPDLVKSLVADGARFALDTTGDPLARAACRAALAPGGTCAFVGPPRGPAADADDQAAEGDPLVVSAEHHVRPQVLIPELAALHAGGRLPLEEFIDFFAFEHFNDALAALRANAVAKPVLRFRLGGFGDLDRALTEGAAQEEPVDPPPDIDEKIDGTAPAEDPALVRSGSD